MWPEVEEAVTKKRHEIRLTGKKLVQRLEDAPEGLEELAAAVPWLTFLDLSDAGPALTSLPANFTGLTQLHELRCVNNQLRSLPAGLGRLPLLRTVILEGNALPALPDDLFGAPRLHTLNASHNALAALPEAALRGAGELHYLDVSHNGLTALPASIVALPKLSTLIVSYNPGLAALPARLSGLSGLLELQAAHCGLRAAPQALAGLPKLKALALEGNPFDDKKLPKVLKEGRLKNILTHIKKHGAPAGAEEAAAEAAAAAAKLQLEEAALPFKLLPVDKGANLDVFVHPEVKDVRPHLVCAALLGVKFTPALYEKFIALQTEIHEGPLCKRRSVAAIGTHDLDSLALPLSYQALPPGEVSFVPLVREGRQEGEGEAAGDGGQQQEQQPADAGGGGGSAAFPPGQAIAAAQLGEFFAADKTMLKYLSYIADRPSKAAPLYAVLRDARGGTVSVSPVINAEPCRVTLATTNILVEVSGADSGEAVQQAGASFLARFGRACAAEAAAGAAGGGGGDGQQQQQQLQVAPVRLLTLGTGHVRSIWPRQ